MPQLETLLKLAGVLQFHLMNWSGGDASKDGYTNSGSRPTHCRMKSGAGSKAGFDGD